MAPTWDVPVLLIFCPDVCFNHKPLNCKLCMQTKFGRLIASGCSLDLRFKVFCESHDETFLKSNGMGCLKFIKGVFVNDDR